MPNVHHAHELGALIDCEEHTVNVGATTVVEDANRLISVEALWRYPESPWKLLERENCPLETIEPGRALAWGPLDDPQVQLFKLSFGVLSEVNAVCHACAAIG